MKSTDALRVLADVTAHQWGMVTSAQAEVHSISRLDLSRLASAGHLTRLTHGVYKDTGAPSDEYENLRAAWLSTEPAVMAEARLNDGSQGVVVAGASAAQLHQIGDTWARRHEFVSPVRRQSQRLEIRFRTRALDSRDVTIVEGLPVMTVERTIADLVSEVGDLSLVADAVKDAAQGTGIDQARLSGLLDPLAKRHGFARADGEGLLNRLLEIAEIDLDSVSERIALNEALASRVAAHWARDLGVVDFERMLDSPALQNYIAAIQGSLATTLAETLAPQLEAIGSMTQEATVNLIKSGALEALARTLGRQGGVAEGLQELLADWAWHNRTASTVQPGILSSIRALEEAATHD